jgi:GT2 family glycosyltransferase
LTKPIKFSVVLPVHNGILHIKECIDSVLSQSYSNFDLIVLENGSNDGTVDFLNSVSDERLKIFPADSFISMEDNWLRINEIPKNEFFTIIGHDDIYDANYLEVMRDLIIDNSNATLFQAHFRFVNLKGEFNRNCLPMAETQFSFEFLATQLQRSLDSMGTGYMMRTSDFIKVGGFSLYKNMIFGDWELWFKLTDIGYKVTSIEQCFTYREHDSISTLTSAFDYQKELFKYLHFIKSKALNNKKLQIIIDRYALEYLHFFCKGLIYRELLNKKNKTQVSTIVINFQDFLVEFLPKQKFNLSNDIYIKFYLILDKIIIGKFFFKFFIYFKLKFKLVLLYLSNSK